MKFTIRGKGDIILEPQKDFIWGGGEGDVYGKGNTVYKIYHDPKKMIPEGKMLELAQLEKDNILRPLDTIIKGNQRVGFTMRRVYDTFALCRLFVADFCLINNISNEAIIKLIEKIKETIGFIHSKQCLIVDGNEFNYLVSHDFKIPYFIDVDSYQTKNSYPATAIMESIRDWHCKKFTELSDWFAFAIIACQLFAKVHPFKGKRNDCPDSLEERMKRNLSIFNAGTRLTAGVKAHMQNIPSSYRDWFIALFEQGTRTLPPDLIASIGHIVKHTIQGSNAFEINEIFKASEQIFYYAYCYGFPVIKTEHEIITSKRSFKADRNTEVLIGHQQLTPVLASIENKKLKLDAGGIPVLPLDLDCTEKMVIDNTLYVKNEGNLIEMFIDDRGPKIIPSIKMVWNIMPNSSTLFSGVVYENILGKPFLVIPKPIHSGNSLCYIMPVKELEGYRIVSAKHDNGVCILVGHKKTYDRIILKFAENYTSYTCKIIKDVDTQMVNFVTLDNGIVILLYGDTIEVFSKAPNNPNSNVIEDTGLADVKLTKNGNQALFIKEDKVFSFSVKKRA